MDIPKGTYANEDLCVDVFDSEMWHKFCTAAGAGVHLILVYIGGNAVGKEVCPELPNGFPSQKQTTDMEPLEE